MTMLIETKIEEQQSKITVRNRAWRRRFTRKHVNNTEASHIAVREFLEQFMV